MQLGPDTPHDQPQDSSPQNPEDSAQIEEQGDLAGAQGEMVQSEQPMGWLDRFRAENSMLPNILIIGGMVLLVFLMMRTLRRTSQANRARNNSLGTPSERIAEIHEKASSSMEPGRKLMVDAEDVARRLGAALDNKAARLELLIEEADSKLDQLNRAIARPESGAIAEDSSSSTSNSGRTLDPSLLDRARVEQDIEDRQTRVAGRIEPLPAPEPAAEVSISDQIQALALSGKSSQEIASELKQPIGQVELIINLQRRSEMS